MPLLDALIAEPPPMQMDDDGGLRVGGTRVRFETIVTAFNNGCTPEEILLKYPSVMLKDVYAVIAYYLWNRDEVESYLALQAQATADVQREVEQRFPMHGIREQLLARFEVTG